MIVSGFKAGSISVTDQLKIGRNKTDPAYVAMLQDVSYRATSDQFNELNSSQAQDDFGRVVPDRVEIDLQRGRILVE